jgi:hypothetical protein
MVVHALGHTSASMSSTAAIWTPGRARGWVSTKTCRQVNTWWRFGPSSSSWPHRVWPRRLIRKHVDNLWLLSGEIIRDLNDDAALRKVTADRLLRDAVHADGGPLIHNGEEETQRSFDSTCRKLHRFLTRLQR